jgi:hypothetical protein
VCDRVVPRSKAKAFFTVSKMVESEKDVRLQTFLNATSLLEADLPVLRYWTTGMTTPFPPFGGSFDALIRHARTHAHT